MDKTVGDDVCWIWQGYVTDRGYGQIAYSLPSVRLVRERAHRFVWLLTHGHIPAGHDVCHRCDNTRCVNPIHLFVGSHRENLRDSIRKGRKRTWGLQKLNAEQVHQIRALCAAGLRQKDVAARFGVAKNTISGIIRGASWSHLPHYVVATTSAQGEELPSKERVA